MRPALSLVLRQMTIWTATLISALGLLIGISMLTPPTPERDLAYSREFQRAKRTLLLTKTQAQPSGRVPASLPPTLAYAEGEDPNSLQALEYQLTCGAEPETLRVEANVAQLRLSGSACKKTKGAQEITASEIVNESNGFSATVFADDSNGFSTDYITLSPGENRIRIRLAYENGGKEEAELVTIRAAQKR